MGQYSIEKSRGVNLLGLAKGLDIGAEREEIKTRVSW